MKWFIAFLLLIGAAYLYNPTLFDDILGSSGTTPNNNYGSGGPTSLAADRAPQPSNAPNAVPMPEFESEAAQRAPQPSGNSGNAAPYAGPPQGMSLNDQCNQYLGGNRAEIYNRNLDAQRYGTQAEQKFWYDCLREFDRRNGQNFGQ